MAIGGVAKGLEHLRYQFDEARRGTRLRRGLERAGVDWLSRPSATQIEDTLAELCGPSGTFFEAGAADGYVESTTYYLERFRGCRGVLVEPVPQQFAACARQRRSSVVVHCALVPPERSGELIRMSWAERMSVVHGALPNGSHEAHLAAAGRYFGLRPFEFEVIGRTISEVLDAAGHGGVDLMTLDLEGYEVEALRGLDLSRHQPRYLMVEMLAPEEMWPALEEMLGGAYSSAGWLTPMDYLYVRNGEEHPALSAHGAMRWRPSTV